MSKNDWLRFRICELIGATINATQAELLCPKDVAEEYQEAMDAKFEEVMAFIESLEIV